MSLLEDYINKSPHVNTVNGQITSSELPMFKIEHVTLPGSLDIVDATVRNNILVIAVANNKLLKIDLANPAEILDLEIPKSKNEGSTINRIYLDETGSHLLVSTTKGDNWYLHPKLTKAAKLKTKGMISCIAWNESGTASITKDILLGLVGGSIIQTSLEPVEGFNKVPDRYSKQVYTFEHNDPVTGMITYQARSSRKRHILLASRSRIEHFEGLPTAISGDIPVLLDTLSSRPGKQEFAPSSAGATKSQLALIPDADTESGSYYAWLNGSGILHGPAPTKSGNESFEEASLLDIQSVLTTPETLITSVVLSKYHILILRDNAIHAYNRYDGSKVFHEQVTTMDPILGIIADQVTQTYWLYSRTELYEIVVHEEARKMCSLFLKRKDYDKARLYALNPAQVNAVNCAQAQSLMMCQRFEEAADVYASTNAPVDQVALAFLDLEQSAALRTYLVKKLDTLKKSSGMQRTMLATWILELFLNQLSSLDDLRNNVRVVNTDSSERSDLCKQFASFIGKHKYDLDKDAAYSLINSHGRQDELLVYANAVNDYEYVVRYYIQQDQYSKALELLVQHSNVELMYSTSTILLPEIPEKTVEMWMRSNTIEPARLLPALLMYNTRHSVSIAENQAIRYLLFTIKHQDNKDPAIHNALVSLYARDCEGDESALLAFLDQQGNSPFYDLDFALRQCKQYNRVLACVHLYSMMGLYDQAVQWALQHENIKLAGVVADRVEDNPGLRKKLWLMIAKETINRGGVNEAIEMSKRSEVLRIEDLVPHFENFTVIDDFKDEICSTLENYASNIEALRREMDESSKTAEVISTDIAELKNRYAMIQPGEECYACHEPLMDKQFYVFPCQHTFHSQCLVKTATQEAPIFQKRRIVQLQTQIARDKAASSQKDNASVANAKVNGVAPSQSSSELQKSLQKARDELDDLIAADCILCGPLMIKSIGEGFGPGDDKVELAEAESWKL